MSVARLLSSVRIIDIFWTRTSFARAAPPVLVSLLLIVATPPSASSGELEDALAACFPAALEGWIAEPVIVDAAKTNLENHELWAARVYKQSPGEGEIKIKVYNSRWCCWLVNFSGDLEKMKIKEKKAGLDEQKTDAIVYVRLNRQVVLSVEAEKIPVLAQTAERFASEIDCDKLKAVIFH